MIYKVSAAVFLCIALTALAAFAAEQSGAPERSPQKEARMRWFREAKFGLFIHWGLYAVPAGQWKGRDYPWIGEWIMNWAQIPVAEYEPLARQFNPTKFDADQIAQLAQDAGMKYLVITAKHHDGFALFPSKASSFDIRDATPFRRDPLQELQRACAGRGLHYGFYYSQAQDWHEPDAAGNDWDFKPPTAQRDPAPYLKRKAMPQVNELLSSYGPIGLIWFDTPVLLNKEQVLELERLVREKQPQCLINSRLGHGLGDYMQMGDNMVPSDVYPFDWEIPATLNDTWGYKTRDHNWKSADYLIYRLADIVSKGGNYLLNIGPRADGTIPQESVDRLRAVGRWLKVNGESIYGTGHSPFSVTDQAWRCTTKPGTLYLHLLGWPAGGKFTLDGLRSDVSGAYLLADPKREPLKTERQGARLVVHLPGDAPDPYDSVLVLKIRGEPDVEPALRWDAPQSVITLTARDCSPHGPYVRYRDFDRTVSGFVESNDKMLWHLLVKKPGRYNVEVEYSCDPDRAGGAMKYHAFGKQIETPVESTGGQYRWLPLGTLDLDRAGLDETLLHLQEPRQSSTVRVRALRLTRIGQ